MSIPPCKTRRRFFAHSAACAACAPLTSRDMLMPLLIGFPAAIIVTAAATATTTTTAAAAAVVVVVGVVVCWWWW